MTPGESDDAGVVGDDEVSGLSTRCTSSRVVAFSPRLLTHDDAAGESVGVVRVQR